MSSAPAVPPPVAAPSPTEGATGGARPRAPRRAGSGALVIAPLATIAVLLMLALALGARPVAPDVVLTTLFDALRGEQGRLVTGGIESAAVLSRIPRSVTALVVGAALAVAGFALQGATHNPLGDPGLLGLGAGAALAMALGIWAGLTASLPMVMLLAVLGTLAAAALVHLAAAAASRSSGGGHAPEPLALVLAGAAVTAGATSVTTALLLLSPSVLERFRYWTVGTVARTGLDDALTTAAIVVAAIALVVVAAPGLDALALGDDIAHGLGARPGLLRGLLLGAAVLLTAAATALAGPVGFIGLMVPHALRRLRPAGTRLMVIGCALWGAALLLAADLVGRTVIAPQEIHVGITVVLLGVPVLLLLLRRRVITL